MFTVTTLWIRDSYCYVNEEKLLKINIDIVLVFAQNWYSGEIILALKTAKGSLFKILFKESQMAGFFFQAIL